MESARNPPTGVVVIGHPLVQTKLSELRDRRTPPGEFRRAMQDLAALMLFEVTTNLETQAVPIETPLAPGAGRVLARPLVAVAILRAGLGMVDGVVRFFPDVKIGHIGVVRKEETFQPQSYLTRLPQDIAGAEVILFDPMLATGGSSAFALSEIKKSGGTRIRFVCAVACPPGIERLRGAHPDVPIFTAAIDEGLDDHAYIVPGLGDAGDRYFGTG